MDSSHRLHKNLQLRDPMVFPDHRHEEGPWGKSVAGSTENFPSRKECQAWLSHRMSLLIQGGISRSLDGLHEKYCLGEYRQVLDRWA